jgi:drug/metabolite transporter (DMT)-like permease
MIGEGLAFALFTGLCWCAIGIVLSRCAREKLDVISYSLLQTALAAAACFVIYASPGKIVLNCGFYLLCTVILAAAILNALAQYLIKRAMDSGNYAPVWAMAQTAMLFPFLCGVICWGNRINGLNILGLILLLAGIVLPCRKGFRQPENWLGLALAAKQNDGDDRDNGGDGGDNDEQDDKSDPGGVLLLELLIDGGIRLYGIGGGIRGGIRLYGLGDGFRGGIRLGKCPYSSKTRREQNGHQQQHGSIGHRTVQTVSFHNASPP